MLNVDAVTFTPDDQGGRIEMQVRSGSQQISSTWPKGEDEEVARLFEQMTVRVEQITVARTASGPEIQAHLTIGERPLAVNWGLEEDDENGREEFDRLLDNASRSFRRQLQLLVGAPEEPLEETPAEAPSKNGRELATVDDGIW